MFLNEDALRDKLTAEREGREYKPTASSYNQDAVADTFTIEADSGLVSALEALILKSNINTQKLGNILVKQAIDMLMHGGNYDSLPNKDAAPKLPPMAYSLYSQDELENQH
ncbi:MAG: hypothetical protein AAF378_05185 [Cyanobacteria bacterium P01_A01_bin.84]